MRTLLALFVFASASAFGLDVTFNLKDFTGGTLPLQRRTVAIDPQSTTLQSSTNFVISERRYYNLGTNAIFTITNMAVGTYRVGVWGITTTSTFGIYVPDVSGSTNASYLLTSSTSGSLQDEDSNNLQADE